MNELPERRFNDIDDLLAFISIYDDKNRTKAYYNMLAQYEGILKGCVCIEAGCGYGLMAERLSQLGAGKVYAVETNVYLYQLARERLRKYDNIVVEHADIRDFKPPEKVDILVHEFFGQLLFDEDIYVLDSLKFSPQYILPNKAVLKMGVLNSQDVVDDIVTAGVLRQLEGALISGLFDDEGVVLDQDVLHWQPRLRNFAAKIDLSGCSGDLLCFGLEIFHDDLPICRAGICDNWSLVWTPRAGDMFTLRFEPSDRGTAVYFQWMQ